MHITLHLHYFTLHLHLDLSQLHLQHAHLYSLGWSNAPEGDFEGWFRLETLYFLICQYKYMARIVLTLFPLFSKTNHMFVCHMYSEEEVMNCLGRSSHFPVRLITTESLIP